MKPQPNRWLPWLLGAVKLSPLVLAVLLVVLLVWRVPQWQVPSEIVAPKARAELENASRDVLVRALGGIFFFVTAYFTWRNLQVAEQNREIAADKQVSERFKNAVQMLGDEKMEVCLGGIYLLERIARNSPEEHWTVMEVLTSFVRERSFNRNSKFQLGQIKSDDQETNIEIGIQTALTVIGRRNHKNELPDHRITLTKAKLHRADFFEANFSGAIFRQTVLSHAFLREAKLNQAIFLEADLTGANLIGANLNRAILNRANLSNADLREADLREANLNGTNLSGADLREANLNGTNLSGADLKDIKWSRSIVKQKLQGLDAALNIPDTLKHQLGLAPQ